MLAGELVSKSHRGRPVQTNAFDVQTVAEALLAQLRQRGVEYLLTNAGTDCAPLIEGMVRGAAAGLPMPEPIVVPHETAAVAMAHGYWLVTGRPQAVMMHVNVGLANGLMGIINAARENVPMLVLSGRTPLTESGHLGSRDLGIHWGQEMRDQGAMVREVVKWDYELRLGDQIPLLVDRALAIASSAPAGPVYMSLPREVLCAPMAGISLSERPLQATVGDIVPGADSLEAAAEILAEAEHPMIVTARAGRGAEGFGALAAFAERFAIPVVEFWAARNALPSAHPMHAGFDPGQLLAEADAVLVLDALVPWIPLRHTPKAGCRVIQAGPDPLFASVPVRGFPADVTLQGDVATVLEALSGPLAARLAGHDGSIASRRERIAKANGDARAALLEAAAAGSGRPMSAAFVSRTIAERIGKDAVVFNELACDPSVMSFERAGTLFGHSLAGGLGWGMPAALGAQLADRDRLVLACVGDGSYMFANPVACHQLAEALGLPILTIVFNNGVWDAVRKSTKAVYPDGHAARANLMPLTSLAPAPDYAMVARASRAHAERVESGAELEGALGRAIEAVRRERRPALLDVVVAPS